MHEKRIGWSWITLSVGLWITLISAPEARGLSLTVAANHVVEWSYQSRLRYENPFRDVEMDVVVTASTGEQWVVPAFWGGGDVWHVRFSASNPGEYAYETRCTDPENLALHGDQGTIQVIPYLGSNRLLKHGPLQLSKNRRHFAHADGTPFFWLADSWWHGMTKRLAWPEGFERLTGDRKEKGFSVIQFAIGMSCDVAPFDARDANEAGHAWHPEFDSINPDYFELVDLRIRHLVRSGLVPNIVGCWGYYLEAMGIENAKRHWRYLIGRYGAYPVTWTLCGEATLPWYEYEGTRQRQAIQVQRTGWSEVGRYLREIDPYHRLMTVHPGPNSGKLAPITNMKLVDFLLLQPGHVEQRAMPASLDHLSQARAAYPDRPSMIGEACFEGMNAACGPKVQRFLFWSTVLGGAPGYSYGADGLWQMNSRDKLFGASPLGQVWGNEVWEDVHQWEGSKNVGTGRTILERFPWWELEPAFELVANENALDYLVPKAAKIPEQLWLVYFPVFVPPWGTPFKLSGLPESERLEASWINPRTGDATEIGRIRIDSSGQWQVPPAPILQDWVLALEVNRKQRLSPK